MAVGEAGVAMVMVIADAITDGEATLAAIGVRIQYHIVLYPEKAIFIIKIYSFPSLKSCR